MQSHLLPYSIKVFDGIKLFASDSSGHSGSRLFYSVPKHFLITLQRYKKYLKLPNISATFFAKKGK